MQKNSCMENLVISLVLLINSFQVKDSKIIKGNILNQNQSPIEYVSVVNKSTNLGTCTLDNGDFSIRASVGDTLFFSCMNYQERLVVVKSTDFTFFSLILEEKSYQIEEVCVYNLGTYQQFKNKILYLKLPPNESEILRERLFGKINLSSTSYRAPIAGTPSYLLPIGSGISFGSAPKTYDKRVKEIEIGKWITRTHETNVIKLVNDISMYKADTLIRFQAFCLQKTKEMTNIGDYELAKIIKGLKIVFEKTILCTKED